MARIQYGQLVSDISGSIGSATFQKSLYGNTLRTKPTGHKSSSAVQQTRQNIMLQCQYAWQALTPAQRKQWDQFIAFSCQSINRDRTILTTGHALFIKYNFQRLLYNLSVLTVPAYISSPLWPSLQYLLIVGGNPWFRFSIMLDGASFIPSLSVSPVRKASQSFSKSGLRFLFDPSISDHDLRFTTQYYNIFGRNLILGDIVHYQFQSWSKTSPILSALQTGIITATSP